MRFLLEYVKLGNIKNLDEAELAKLIETNLDKYSPTDANNLIMAWCEKHFGNKGNWDKLKNMYPLIKADIEENGVTDINKSDNNLWKFLDTFNAAKLTPSQAGILYNCLTATEDDTNYLNANYSPIKDPAAYRSDRMLQTLIFLSNKKNIRRFGLADTSNDSEIKQLIRDVLNTKDDKELQTLINSKQTEYLPSLADSLLDDRRTKKYFVNSASSDTIDWDELKVYLLKVSESMDNRYYGLLTNIFSAIESDPNGVAEQITALNNTLVDDDISVVKASKDFIENLVNSFGGGSGTKNNTTKKS